MERQMSATQTRINFGEVLRYVTQEQRPVIVEHSGKPQAVILALEDYQEYKRLKAEQQLAFDAVLRQAQRARAQTRVELAGKTLPDIAEMIQQMREERDVQLDQALSLRG